MANTNDPLDQADAAERADLQSAQQIVGEHAIAQQQDGYARTIAANKAAAPAPVPASRWVAALPPEAQKAAANQADQIAETPGAIWSAAVHGVAEMATSVNSLAAINTPQLIWEGISSRSSDPNMRDTAARNAQRTQDVNASIRAGADAITPDINGTSGKLIKGTLQFLTNFLPINRVAKTASLVSTPVRIGATALAGGVANASAFDPNSGHLGDFLSTVPALKGPVTSFLKTNPGDSAALGALKNGIEGALGSAVGDTIVEGVTHAITGIRAWRGVADSTKAIAEAPSTVIEHEQPNVVSTKLGYTKTQMPASQLPAGLAKDAAAFPDNAISFVAHDSTTGEALAHVTTVPSGGQMRALRMDTVESARGNGIARDLLGDAIDHAHANDMPFVSDTQLSTGAQKVYESVPGREIKANKQFDVANDATDGAVNVSSNGRPLYEAPVPPKVLPYEPPVVNGQDTTHPTSPPQPEDVNVAGEAPKVFDPKKFASTAIKISPEKQEAFMQQLAEGKYNNVTQMLDDTHKTIPFAQMHEGANLQGIFNAVTEHFGDAIRAANGPVHVSDAVVSQFAKDIGGNVNDLQRTFANLTDNGGLAPHIMAGEYMQIASTRQLQDLLETARSLNRDTDAGKAALLAVNDQMEMHSAIVGMVRQNKAEVARAFRILQQTKASTQVQLTNLDDLVGTVLGPGALDKFQKTLRDAKDLASVNNAVDNMRNSGGIWSWLREIAQHGMISNIATQTANLSGNIGGLLRVPLERYLAGTIGEVRGVLMPGSEHASIRSAIAHTEGMIQGLHDSFPMAVKALSWMEEPAVSATGQAMRRAIHVDTTGMIGPKLTGAQALNITGAVIRYPGRAMGAIDHFNTGAGAQADLYARAYTQSAMEADAKGLRGDSRDTFITQRSQEIRTNPTTEMRDASILQGNRQAFLEEPQTSLGGPVGKALSANPLVKLIVSPYFQRPMNMLRQSLVDYTPLGLGNKAVRESLLSNTQDTDLALARMSIGTGAILYGYHLAASGLNNGSGLGLKNTASLADIPKDTVQIGGRWWRYDRFDPIGVWLHVAADLHEIVNRYHDPNDPKGEADLATLTRMGVQTVGMAMMDKSAMKSADGLMKAMSEKNGARADKLMEDLVATNVLKFVPFSGLLRGAANTVDPTIRAAGGEGLPGIWDAAKRQLPYLSQDLPPARDVLGRPRLHLEGNTAWWNPFSGAPPSQDHTDQELAKVAVAIRTPPRQLENVTLDAHQYDEVLRNATQTKMFPGETNLAEYMKATVASPMWEYASRNSDNGVAFKTKVVQQIIDKAYDTGGKLYMRDHPEFMQLKIKQAQNRAALFAPAPAQ